MHLMNLLIEQPVLATPRSYALAALMYLNAARLPTRLDGSVVALNRAIAIAQTGWPGTGIAGDTGHP